MRKYSLETAVGVFVFAGILCVGFLALKLGKLDLTGNDHYTLSARFASAAGLKPGAAVEMAGVEIGKVDRIKIDSEDQVAVVYLKIRKDIEITSDAIASIKTSGLIGDKYVKITSGGMDKLLSSGDAIRQTESAVDLEELISKYIFGKL